MAVQTLNTSTPLRLSCMTLAFFSPSLTLFLLAVIHFRYLFFSFSEATRGSAVKRFSISFARHPTNGMFAFVHSLVHVFPSHSVFEFMICSSGYRVPPSTAEQGIWQLLLFRGLKIPIQHTGNQQFMSLHGGLFTWISKIAVSFVPSSVKKWIWHILLLPNICLFICGWMS